MSVSSTSPATLFGGTWEQLKDRFLVGAGNSYAVNSTGGKSTQHLQALVGITGGQVSHLGFGHTNEGSPRSYNATYSIIGTSCVSGEGFNHLTRVVEWSSASDDIENKPPYLAVYMWKRIA